jgi:hypothetical protein
MGDPIDTQTYGTYNICEVCGWEDDQVQLANPCSGGGANSESLYESQLQALKKVPLEIKEHEGICRSSTWRPLNQKEIDEFTTQTREKHWANKGVLVESEAYWSKNS